MPTHCRRCGYEWTPRTDEEPKQCPRCKSPKWQVTVSQNHAHTLVNQAIRRGDLPALDGSVACVDCGEPAQNYDHRDYAHPLAVDPVCRSCNVKRGSGANRIPTKGVRKVRIILNDELAKTLDEWAIKDGRSFSNLVSVLLRKAVIQEEQQEREEK